MSTDSHSMLHLPEVFEGQMTPAQIDTYVADLQNFAEMLDVFVKDRPRSLAGIRPLDLEQAGELVKMKKVRAVQLRYRFDHHEWRDTLLVQNDTIKLVRMQMPDLTTLPEQKLKSRDAL